MCQTYIRTIKSYETIKIFRKLLNHLIKKANFLPQLYGRLFGYKEYTRFVIVSYARTGSNYLLEGIISSGTVHIYHEIFAEHRRKIGKDFEKIFSQLFWKQNRKIKAVGFKLFYYHFTDDEWSKFLSYEDFGIIHLTRKNRLRTLVSLDIAFNTNRWTSGIKNSNKQPEKIYLNPLNLIERIEEIENYENIARKRFQNRRVIEVTYEDITANPEKEFKRIADFLGIENIYPERIHLQKQNPENSRELIKNFDEISVVLSNSRFSDYLNS